MLKKFRQYVYLTKQKLENSRPDELLVIGSSHGRYGFDKSGGGGEPVYRFPRPLLQLSTL